MVLTKLVNVLWFFTSSPPLTAFLQNLPIHILFFIQQQGQRK